MTRHLSSITVDSIAVEVVRKAIKNLYLRVSPPNGRVRVAVPLAMSQETVRSAVRGKMEWILRHQARFAGQLRPPPLQMAEGETHLFLGQPYPLRLIDHLGAARVQHALDGFDLFARPDASAEQRRLVLERWYRRQLQLLIPPLLEQWQPRMGVQAAAWGIRTMKTKWGSCNTRTRRIWLNLELVKRPPQCLEFVLVHELAHLLERSHNARFKALLDQFLPQWRQCKRLLAETPLWQQDQRQ